MPLEFQAAGFSIAKHWDSHWQKRTRVILFLIGRVWPILGMKMMKWLQTMHLMSMSNEALVGFGFGNLLLFLHVCLSETMQPFL